MWNMYRYSIIIVADVNFLLTPWYEKNEHLKTLWQELIPQIYIQSWMEKPMMRDDDDDDDVDSCLVWFYYLSWLFGQR